MRRALDLRFDVGHAPTLDARPSRFVPATVPGAVQLDWARAEGWGPYWYGDNFRQYRFMEDVFWTYQTVVPEHERTATERLHLVLGGVDYRFAVRVAGRVVHEQEGMFTPVDLDLTQAPPNAPLEIVIFPAPKMHGSPEDRSEARGSCKPAVSYGWDWHPRLVPLGLFEPAFLEIRPASHLTDASLTYRLSEDLARAHVCFTASVAAPTSGQIVRFTLIGPDGELTAKAPAAAEVRVEAVVEKPQLWWCHGQGEQPLYRLLTTLESSGAEIDRKERRTGFRRVRFVQNADAWDHPKDFPKGRASSPVTLELNGRRVFIKGTNFVPPEIFPGLVTADTYRPLLAAARGAHLNLLTCWGGGMIGKESFYDQCDELGLMVSTDFPLACNNYDDGGESYLTVLEQEAKSILSRVRTHPSNVLWKGGVELFNGWSRMHDQSLPLRLLGKLAFEADRDTPFLPTTPVDGMGHGDYRFRDEHDRDVFQIFQSAAKDRFTAYSEFGCPGPADVETLRTFIPGEELFPIRFGTAWQWHHGLRAWDADETTWLCLRTLEHYFGESKSLEDLVARGQWLQAEGLRSVYEEGRRQQPLCSWVANWCFGEPWPTAANNSLLSWPARPKPALAAVTSACRPVLASARIPRFDWTAGDELECELWLLNDSPNDVTAGSVHASVELGSATHELGVWNHPAMEPSENRRGPTLRLVLPDAPGADRLTIALRVPGHPGRESRYALLYRPATRAEETPRRLNM